MKFQIMKQHRREFSVLEMSRILNVSATGFYSWLKRPISNQTNYRERLKIKIRDIYFNKHRRFAGSHLITAELKDCKEYRNVNRTRVASLMQSMGLRCKTQRKFVPTTDSNHDKPVAGNVLNRKFSAKAPGKVLVGDITYIRVASHWVYLSVFIDLFSRKVVGWDLSPSLSADSTCMALKKYLFKNGYKKKMIIHSDRGIQYASDKFRKIIKNTKAVQSMSRKGNCWDNAVAESFFHTLKTRLIHNRKYDTIKELQRDLFWYINIYYNRVRKHSTNQWMTPQEKEDIFFNKKKAA